MALAMLILMSVLFAVTHIGMSHDPFRARLVERVGPKGFQLLYTVVSIVTFGAAVWIFAHNRKAGPLLWATHVWIYPIVYLLMLLAFLLLVLSMRDRSPAMMVGGKMRPEGVLRITRHPMNMALACFGLAHMLANGSLGDVFFFGSIFVVGFFGCYHQDRRKVREKGDEYVAFQRRTGIFPFAAILQGKTRLEAGDLSKPLVILAVLAYVAAILGHQDLFGVPPY